MNCHFKTVCSRFCSRRFVPLRWLNSNYILLLNKRYLKKKKKTCERSLKTLRLSTQTWITDQNTYLKKKLRLSNKKELILWREAFQNEFQNQVKPQLSAHKILSIYSGILMGFWLLTLFKINVLQNQNFLGSCLTRWNLRIGKMMQVFYE